MKVSLHWLNRLLEPAIDIDETERLLTAGGFPVEDTEAVGDDTMIDVEVTSNRPDVLSHVGVAREIAARSEHTLNTPACDPPAEAGSAVDALASVENEAPDLCTLYTARVITGVKVGQSPDWLVQALEAVGQRSVNNIVDITNFVLLELGQPLHAFDLAKLAGNKVIVRKATKDERFEAIDHSRHKLQDDMLVIADGDKPVALAGVMGGADSEVTDTTTGLLIESAMFDELAVRRASRKLKLFSDSSFRFERGVDPLGVEKASQRCCELIMELAGGTLAQGVIRVGQDDPSPAVLTLRTQRTRDLLGIELSANRQAGLLEALGIQTNVDDEQLTATIPSYRLDLAREIDLIEEIARQHGLANIPTNEKINIVAHHPQDNVEAKRIIVETLVAHGYYETITPSLITNDHAKAFVDADAAATLVGDMRRADNTLRPSPLPSLLSCRKLNQDAGNAGVKLFELASGWQKDDGSISEQRSLTLLRDAGDGQQALRETRSTIEETLTALAGEQIAASGGIVITPAEIEGYATAAAIVLSGTPLGVFGVIDKPLADRFGLQTQLIAAQLDLDSLITLYPPKHEAGELPKYPAIERDLSVVVDEATPWQQIADTIATANPALLESADFVGTYRGKQVGKGKKSVTLRMQFRDPVTTLRHDQVDPQVETVVKALGEKVGAELRV
ncbi:MAG: phenylalanine--tRNA ligase subunit beta [Phycisphaeraceae bacterium]|nr:phenylalanine--tRNA ligase subunit beta [Phycisphaeraceae bacterium]